MGIVSAGAAGAGKDIDLFSHYGSIGESSTTHAETDTTTLFATGAAGEVIALDLSSVFSSLSSGDVCGVQIDHQGIGGDIDYLGILLVYDP